MGVGVGGGWEGRGVGGGGLESQVAGYPPTFPPVEVTVLICLS